MGRGFLQNAAAWDRFQTIKWEFLGRRPRQQRALLGESSARLGGHLWSSPVAVPQYLALSCPPRQWAVMPPCGAWEPHAQERGFRYLTPARSTCLPSTDGVPSLAVRPWTSPRSTLRLSSPL